MIKMSLIKYILLSIHLCIVVGSLYILWLFYGTSLFKGAVVICAIGLIFGTANAYRMMKRLDEESDNK